ncbi:MAG: hypothetical protein WBB18_10055 [Nodosilinea sp.]
MNSPPRLTKALVAEPLQPAVVLPDLEVERSQSSPPAAPLENSSALSLTYLQTLQAARTWVLAPPEPRPEQASPRGSQEIVAGEIELTPPARQRQDQRSATMDQATVLTPFSLAATEPTTVISIGSIEVMVEGPPAPPAPARSSRSSRPAPRLSRHYLRLR